MRIIRLKEVRDRTGLSPTEIYRKVADDAFPQPRQLGPRAIGWIEEEIDEWIAELPRGLKPQPASLKACKRKLEEAHAT